MEFPKYADIERFPYLDEINPFTSLRKEVLHRLRRHPRFLRAVGVAGMALLGHVGGIAATTIAPAHVETANYNAAVSLGWQTNGISVTSSVGDVTFNYGGFAPDVTVRPQLGPGIIQNYAKDGLDGVRPNEATLTPLLPEIATDLALRYGVGVAVIEAALLAAFGVGRREISRRSIKAAIGAGIAAATVTIGGAAMTYSHHYESYEISGLAGELQASGQGLLTNLDARSKAAQPYVEALLNVSVAVSRTPEGLTDGNQVQPTGPSLLLISDIHDINMYETVKQVAEAQHVDAVIDSGDMLVAGRVDEAEITKLFDGIASLDVPYIFVLGNHDKSSLYDTALVTRLQAIPNVILLQPKGNTYTEVNIGDLTIAGMNDPRYFGDDAKNTGEKQTPAVDQFNNTFNTSPPDIAITHEAEAADKMVTSKNGITINGHGHVPGLDDNHVHVGSLTGGGLIGQNDSTDPEQKTPVQSFTILRTWPDCRIANTSSIDFTGYYLGRITASSINYHVFDPRTQVTTDAPARQCTDRTLTTRTITAAELAQMVPVPSPTISSQPTPVYAGKP